MKKIKSIQLHKLKDSYSICAHLYYNCLDNDDILFIYLIKNRYFSKPKLYNI